MPRRQSIRNIDLFRLTNASGVSFDDNVKSEVLPIPIFVPPVEFKTKAGK